MPIELNKILRDIAEESFLKPTTNAKKEEIEQAWVRVAKKSNLSVHETKSIFKVLQKKYEQERLKDQSTWKLFEVMNEIHTPADEDEEDEESEISMEENEEYEMLEVDEEQQQDLQPNDDEENENTKNEQTPTQKSANLKKPSEMTSDGESPTKSKSDTSHENSPERASEKQADLKKSAATQQQTAPREEKKLLNSLLSPNSPRLSKPMTATSAAIALQKKGITLKKTNTAQKTQSPQTSQSATNQSLLRNSQAADVGRTIQLPESIKRRLNEDAMSPAPVTKKILLGQPSGTVKQISPKTMTPKTLSQSKLSSSGTLIMRKESDEKCTLNSRDENSSQNATTVTNTTDSVTLSTPTVTTHHGLKVITFPVETKNEENSANTTGLKVITFPVEGNGSLIQNGTSTSIAKKAIHVTTNGISQPQIEELDFSEHVLISSNAANDITIKGDKNISNIIKTCPDTKEGSLNLGNFSNDLPRAFFNNLCDSKRHEALCLYAANVMNRLDPASAARLELKIMRALLDAQSEALKES